MRIVEYENAQAFYDRVVPYLVQREAAHNLLLGVAGGMRRAQGEGQPAVDAFRGVIERDGEIVMVALRTPPYLLAVSLPARDEDCALAHEIFAQAVYARYGNDLPGVILIRHERNAFLNHWRVLTGMEARVEVAMRIYQLTNVIPVDRVRGVLRQARREDRDLLVRWTQAFMDEALPNDPNSAEAVVDARLESATAPLFIWEADGHPVSMAGVSGATPNGIRINLVYTPPELRRHGYASAAVAELSRRMLESGRKFCFLFTDLANPTSNKIYMRIGYVPVCDVDNWRFYRPE